MRDVTPSEPELKSSFCLFPSSAKFGMRELPVRFALFIRANVRWSLPCAIYKTPPACRDSPSGLRRLGPFVEVLGTFDAPARKDSRNPNGFCPSFTRARPAVERTPGFRVGNRLDLHSDLFRISGKSSDYFPSGSGKLCILPLRAANSHSRIEWCIFQIELNFRSIHHEAGVR